MYFGRTDEQLIKANKLEKIHGFSNSTDYYCRTTGNCIIVWDTDVAGMLKVIGIKPDGTTTKTFSLDEYKIIDKHILIQTNKL